jgi:lipoprotein-anchoring transpeptidase ErfK/SrfK
VTDLAAQPQADKGSEDELVESVVVDDSFDPIDVDVNADEDAEPADADPPGAGTEQVDDGAADAEDANADVVAPAAEDTEDEGSEAEDADATPVDEDADVADADDAEIESGVATEAGADPAETVDADAPTTVVAPVDDAPTAVIASQGDAPTAIVATTATATLSPATETAPMTDAGEPVYAWAPPEPQPKKKHTALWISAAAAVAVVGLVASSLVLIAPGTSVAGVPVGWVVIAGEDGEVEVTGAELGATVDAQALADTAFAEHPMWNPTAWFAPPVDATVELDPVAATEALRAVLPEVYTDPVDAAVTFDPASASYVTTPATLGTGIDVATVQSALQEAFEAGQTSVEIDPVLADVPAGLPTETADATVAQLNGMLDAVGFYVGEERTVPVDRAVAASWLTVSPGDGEFEITADPDAIQPVVDTLAPAVNRAPENARVITDSAGKVLREESGGQSGRELGDTSDVASDFAAQLADGNAAYALPVAEVPVTTVSIARRIEVDLGDQRTYLFENGNVVQSYAISSGLPGTPTPTGSFRVYAHTAEQDLGALCYDPTRTDSYCTKDVKWLTWFAPDIAFHATYWHNNFGNRMSHGCVNMPTNVAEFVYRWAPVGTEVWVHG